MTLDAELLGILACPACRGALEALGANPENGPDANPDAGPQGLACPRCSLVYPVRDEIPVMLTEEAIPRREWDAGKRETTNASSSTPGSAPG